jgi:hypothetical protein
MGRAVHRDVVGDQIEWRLIESRDRRSPAAFVFGAPLTITVVQNWFEELRRR